MANEILEVIDTLDEKIARKIFSNAFMKNPMSRVEVVSGFGAPIYRITVVSSEWSIQ